ncbi:hypothetical protein [Hyalangium gracile]|uniref:hypothetical protein n=1 Tax=Hyalangium gracile TaxID=394092 RepID=UPI001CCF259F|nr:hypothetical protein [Hyalangium gracile]
MSRDCYELIACRVVLCAMAVSLAFPGAALAGGGRLEPEPPLLLQREKGLVAIRSVTGEVQTRLKKVHRYSYEPYRILALTVELENELSAAVWPLDFEVFLGGSQERFSKRLQVTSWQTLPPRGRVPITIDVPLEEHEPAHAFEVVLSRYGFEGAPGAGLLLQLAASEGPVDQVAAVTFSSGDSLPAHTREQLARDFAEEVKAGPAGERASTLAPLLALYALGRVGREEAVPVLLEALTREAAYQEASPRVEALRKQFPESPVPHAFPHSHVREVVAGALGTLAVDDAVRGLVRAAYTGDERLRKHAREMLDQAWPKTGSRVAGLRGASAAPVPELLCQGGDALAVRLLVALSALGADGGMARGCIAALPDTVVVPALLATLREPLRTAEPLAVELLQARSRSALPALREATRGSKVAPGADVAELAQALAQSAHARHLEQFQQAMATLTTLLDEPSMGGASIPRQRSERLAALRLAQAHAGAEQTGQLVQAYLRVCSRNWASEWVPTRRELSGLSELILASPPEAEVDSILESLARRIAERLHEQAAAPLLEQLKPLFVDPARLASALPAPARPKEPAPGIVWERFLLAALIPLLALVFIVKAMGRRAS